MAESNRLLWIDIAKGIGIILVVLGHIVSGDSLVHRYIYMFHMPLFFLISGYLYNDNREISIRGFATLRFKRLLVPFLVFLIVPSIIHGLYRGSWSYLFEWINTEVVFADPPIWFLLVLFIVSIISKFRIFRKLWVTATLSLIFYIVSQFVAVKCFIDTISISLLFYCIGNKLRRCGDWGRLSENPY